MKFPNVALAVAALSLSVLAAPTPMIDERSPDANANADHAYPIEVEGMLARLDRRESVRARSANAEPDVDRAYPIEVEGMLARLERRVQSRKPMPISTRFSPLAVGRMPTGSEGRLA